ncbi:MAG: SDR family NAD(P)-dependent oxidoreductase [Beijerinckiaceae bacterium]|nr:SDR family NAD(P)-dependent oxidoreductase [Beijerinckiaceae bacterium]
MSNGKVWFITGSSRGFGRVWAEAALERGDKVVATARNPAVLQPLVDTYGRSVLPLALDVTDRAAAFEAVAKGREAFGRLDVVLNNAGYGQLGAVEELGEAEVRAQIETNLFGALWVTQAALPILRAQKSGHILAVSSIGGVATFPTAGMYHASKWGLEGLMDALSQEVAGFGIKVTLIEPGGYATNFADPSSIRASAPIAAYAPIKEQVFAAFASESLGDPQATSEAIFKVVDAAEPPLRLLLGATAVPMVRAAYEQRLATWDAWASVSAAAQGTRTDLRLPETFW